MSNGGYSKWDLVRFYVAIIGAILFVMWLANHIEAL